MIEFGEQLKKAREAKGLTQQSLADQLFVTRQAVSRWERGERFPDLATTKKISTILEVSMDNLMADTALSTVVEKSPIVENSITKKIILLLYAFIATSFLVNVVDEVSNIGFFIKLEKTPITLSTFILVFQAIIFIVGFILALRGNLTPRNIGIITSAFFTFSCLYTIYNAYDAINDNYKIFINHELPLTCVILVSRIILIIASIEYFCKNKHTKLWSIILNDLIITEHVILLLFTGLAALMFSTNILLFILVELSEVLIPVLIVIEVITLNKKRKLANSEKLSLG